MLLQLLTRQDEDAEEGEWNVSMAAGTCLAFLAQAVHDTIVPPVIPFIEANIKQDNWHRNGMLTITSIEPWTILLDGREVPAGE